MNEITYGLTFVAVFMIAVYVVQWK